LQSIDDLADRFLNYLLVEKGLSLKTLEAYGSDIVRYLSFLDKNGIKHIADREPDIWSRSAVFISFWCRKKFFSVILQS
jgi:site-specific recombinase XerD